MSDEQKDWDKERELRHYDLRRERFAVAAMRGIISQMQDHPFNWNILCIADTAVQMADALEERLHPDPNKPILPPYEA